MRHEHLQHLVKALPGLHGMFFGMPGSPSHTEVKVASDGFPILEIHEDYNVSTEDFTELVYFILRTPIPFLGYGSPTSDETLETMMKLEKTIFKLGGSDVLENSIRLYYMKNGYHNHNVDEKKTDAPKSGFTFSHK